VSRSEPQGWWSTESDPHPVSSGLHSEEQTLERLALGGREPVDDSLVRRPLLNEPEAAASDHERSHEAPVLRPCGRARGPMVGWTGPGWHFARLLEFQWREPGHVHPLLRSHPAVKHSGLVNHLKTVSATPRPWQGAAAAFPPGALEPDLLPGAAAARRW